MQFEDLEQLCNDPRARAAVLAEMNAVGKEGQVTFFTKNIIFTLFVVLVLIISLLLQCNS